MIKGQCLCGAIQFQYHGEIEASILCYCQHCQQAQGSFAAWNRSSIQSALRSLSKKQIIFKPENGTYEIEDALFKEWIMDEA